MSVEEEHPAALPTETASTVKAERPRADQGSAAAEGGPLPPNLRQRRGATCVPVEIAQKRQLQPNPLKDQLQRNMKTRKAVDEAVLKIDMLMQQCEESQASLAAVVAKVDHLMHHHEQSQASSKTLQDVATKVDMLMQYHEELQASGTTLTAVAAKVDVLMQHHVRSQASGITLQDLAAKVDVLMLQHEESQGSGTTLMAVSAKLDVLMPQHEELRASGAILDSVAAKVDQLMQYHGESQTSGTTFEGGPTVDKLMRDHEKIEASALQIKDKTTRVAISENQNAIAAAEARIRQVEADAGAKTRHLEEAVAAMETSHRSQQAAVHAAAEAAQASPRLRAESESGETPRAPEDKMAALEAAHAAQMAAVRAESDAKAAMERAQIDAAAPEAVGKAAAAAAQSEGLSAAERAEAEARIRQAEADAGAKTRHLEEAMAAMETAHRSQLEAAQEEAAISMAAIVSSAHAAQMDAARAEADAKAELQRAQVELALCEAFVSAAARPAGSDGLSAAERAEAEARIRQAEADTDARTRHLEEAMAAMEAVHRSQLEAAQEEAAISMAAIVSSAHAAQMGAARAEADAKAEIARAQVELAASDASTTAAVAEAWHRSPAEASQSVVASAVHTERPGSAQTAAGVTEVNIRRVGISGVAEAVQAGERRPTESETDENACSFGLSRSQRLASRPLVETAQKDVAVQPVAEAAAVLSSQAKPASLRRLNSRSLQSSPQPRIALHSVAVSDQELQPLLHRETTTAVNSNASFANIDKHRQTQIVMRMVTSRICSNLLEMAFSSWVNFSQHRIRVARLVYRAIMVAEQGSIVRTFTPWLAAARALKIRRIQQQQNEMQMSLATTVTQQLDDKITVGQAVYRSQSNTHQAEATAQPAADAADAAQHVRGASAIAETCDVLQSDGVTALEAAHAAQMAAVRAESDAKPAMERAQIDAAAPEAVGKAAAAAAQSEGLSAAERAEAEARIRHSEADAGAKTRHLEEAMAAMEAALGSELEAAQEVTTAQPAVDGSASNSMRFGAWTAAEAAQAGPHLRPESESGEKSRVLEDKMAALEAAHAAQMAAVRAEADAKAEMERAQIGLRLRRRIVSLGLEAGQKEASVKYSAEIGQPSPQSVAAAVAMDAGRIGYGRVTEAVQATEYRRTGSEMAERSRPFSLSRSRSHSQASPVLQPAAPQPTSSLEYRPLDLFTRSPSSVARGW